MLPWPLGRLLLGSLVATYFVLTLAAALSSAKRSGVATLYLPLAFAILHLSYGSGFLKGLFVFRHRWHAPDETERDLGATA